MRVTGHTKQNVRMTAKFATSASPAAVTLWARRIRTLGGSLQGVQLLAGHSALGTTQRYIDSDGMAQRRVVEIA